MSFFGFSRNHRSKVARSIVVSMVAGSSSAVYAQVDDEIPADLEALVDAAQSPETAIAAAREQMADDDLSGAASTLERALLNNRNADEVRALYATVLCKLDDPKGAAVEVGLLERGNISSAGLTELQANCGLTPDFGASPSSDADGSQFWGTASAGIAYDSDAIGAITLQFFDPTVANPLPAFSADGLALTNSVNINYRSDPKGGSTYLYGSGSIDSKIQLAGTKIPNGSIQFQLAEIRLGLGGSSGTTEFNIGPVFRHGRIYNDPFVNEYGMQAGAAFQSGANSQILVDAEIVQEDFTANVNGNPFTDGLKISFSLASLTRTDDKGNYIYFGAEGQYKEADFRDYSSARVFAAARFPLGENGTYAKLNATARYVDYRTSSGPTERKDFRLYGRAALGIPINDDGFFLEGGVSYSLRDSNGASGVHDFDSFGADMKLVWKF